MITAFGLGFLVKTIASLDDTFTKVPILLGVTRTRKGKLAFIVGNFIALGVIVAFAEYLSHWMQNGGWFRPAITIFILLLATAIYFDLPAGKQFGIPKTVLKKQHLKTKRLLKLIGIGFVISFFALIDDALVFVPLFTGTSTETFAAVTGIFASTALQLLIVLISVEWIEKIPHKKLISVGGLILFAALVGTGTI